MLQCCSRHSSRHLDDERTPLLAHTDGLDAVSRASIPAGALQHVGAAVGAAQAGKWPSNDQICALLERLLASEMFQVQTGGGAAGQGRLSASSHRVAMDMRQFLQAVNGLAREKNSAHQLRS